MYKDVGGKMGQKGMDFKHKEVININDGRKLGYRYNNKHYSSWK